MQTAAVPSLGLKYALLGLVIDHPIHPYEMHQQLLEAKALGLVWHLKQGHLYAMVASLEEAGYLTSTTESQGTRPPRKVLHLTPAGRSAFENWVATPVAHGRDLRQEFLAKLFFAAQQSAAAAVALISRQRDSCESWIRDLRQEIQALEVSRRYERLVLQFRLSQMEAVLSWLDQCEQAMEAPESPRK
jgi:PadR family transcriptional regulator AphA